MLTDDVVSFEQPGQGLPNTLQRSSYVVFHNLESQNAALVNVKKDLN